MTLIQKQTTDPTWGAFASGCVSFELAVPRYAYTPSLSRLQNGGFGAPRRGKNNDKAHPPIHPTAHAANLAGQEKQVYEFITRRFLACCSKDAEGFETTVDVVSNGEFFYATGDSALTSFPTTVNTAPQDSSCWSAIIWKCIRTISGVARRYPISRRARSSCRRNWN